MKNTNLIKKLDWLANEGFAGRTGPWMANEILQMRFDLMNTGERKQDLKDIEASLATIAGTTLGKIKTKKKSKSSAENGKKGGRPKTIK